MCKEKRKEKREKRKEKREKRKEKREKRKHLLNGADQGSIGLGLVAIRMLQDLRDVGTREAQDAV